MSQDAESKPRTVWFKALDTGELPEGRFKPVTCALRTVCMTHFEGKFAALDGPALVEVMADAELV